MSALLVGRSSSHAAQQGAPMGLLSTDVLNPDRAAHTLPFFLPPPPTFFVHLIFHLFTNFFPFIPQTRKPPHL